MNVHELVTSHDAIISAEHGPFLFYRDGLLTRSSVMIRFRVTVQCNAGTTGRPGRVPYHDRASGWRIASLRGSCCKSRKAITVDYRDGCMLPRRSGERSIFGPFADIRLRIASTSRFMAAASAGLPGQESKVARLLMLASELRNRDAPLQKHASSPQVPHAQSPQLRRTCLVMTGRR